MNLQLLRGQLALAHGAGVMGIQAVLHTQNSVHVVTRLHLRDQLSRLLHEVHLDLMIRGDRDGLHQRADGLRIAALDEVIHLSDHQRHVGHLIAADLAGKDIGQLEGLVFGNFDLVHDKYP